MREFTTTHVKSLDVKKALGRDVKNTFPLTTHALAYALRAKVSPQCFGPRKTDFEKKTETNIKKNKKTAVLQSVKKYQHRVRRWGERKIQGRRRGEFGVFLTFSSVLGQTCHTLYVLPHPLSDLPQLLDYFRI